VLVELCGGKRCDARVGVGHTAMVPIGFRPWSKCV
jgi:hypothetical protein